MNRAKSKKTRCDHVLLITVLMLLGIGLVMVASASSYVAFNRTGDPYFFLKRQALFCLFGLGVMFCARYIPSKFYSKIVWPLLVVSFLLLVALFVPGIGHRVGGAVRWIKIGPFSFQPSELAKVSLALFMAFSMASKGEELKSFSKGLAPFLVVSFAFAGLLLLQPDVGTAVMIVAWSFIMLFVGGARFVHLSGIIALLLPFVFWVVQSQPYRVKRFMAFLNPWADPTGIGFQVIHSFFAFASGGLLGVGIGASKEKLYYLPEPHTDFVFSILAEEAGLLGVSVVVALFGILIWRGLKVALSATDLPGSYLAFAITLWIGLQVLVNMGVVLGLLPTKGLTLPLLSYGGSSILITLLSIGILLNISARSR